MLVIAIPEKEHLKHLCKIFWDLLQRVAEALNVSLRTVSTVSQACKSGNPLQSPKKTKKREKPVTDVDDFDQSAIRNVIYEMIQNSEYILFYNYILS